MAFKLPDFKFFTQADAKTRVFILFAGIAAVSLVIFLIVRFFSGGSATTGTSRVATAPSELQTVPGGKMSPEFYRAVVQANAQAAKQAQITGGSAVPTLINVPGQTGFPEANCTILCPSEENVNVADDINSLIKQGKLSQEDGNHLLELANNNVPVDEYAAALNDLVRQGKLTPEQARALLEKYRKQHAGKLNNESGAVMDALIKSGQLPLDVANSLLALQKSGISPADYAAELNRLVKEGKISPETAARLLAQYTQQQLREQAKQGAFNLQQMTKAGQVTPDVAKELLDLQNKNIPADQYEAELNKLVAAGKITPAVAAKLLADYKKQKAGLIPTAGGGRGVAGTLATLTNSPNPNVRALAQKLAAMQSNNASLADYTDALKSAVQAGLISPEMAARLLEEYRAMITPITPAGGVAPGVETNVPGGAEFAKLQQNVQAAAPETPPAGPEEFVAPQPPPPIPGETAEEKQQRLNQIQSAMAAQAQSLLAAWQPPTMSHKEGAGAAGGEKGKSSTTTTTTTTGAGKAGETTALKRDLIKSGTILFAILDTAVDSDYPDTPVMATIIMGPYKGAKLLGKLALAQGQDKVSLIFNTMDMESWPTTKDINAFAIDPDTARTVMASNVDHHYLKRYGAIMGTAFLTGYSNAIMTAGSTTTTGIFGTSTVHPQFSPTQKIAVGLGQVGTTIGSQIANYINTPTTVKVNSGVGIGILFMKSVKE